MIGHTHVHNRVIDVHDITTVRYHHLEKNDTQQQQQKVIFCLFASLT